MLAARYNHECAVAFLIKYGANIQTFTRAFGNAADISRASAASAKQTQYMEARVHTVQTLAATVRGSSSAPVA
jgi:hypothetical protein